MPQEAAHAPRPAPGRATRRAGGRAAARAGRWRVGAVCAVWAWGLACAAVAQVPDPVVPVAEVALADVEAELRRLAEAVDLAPEVKQSLIETYTAALGELKLEAEWLARAAQYESGVQSAAAELAAARSLLAQPAADKPDEPPAEAPLDKLAAGLVRVQAALATARDELATLDAEQKRRDARREQVRADDDAARAALSEVDRQRAALPAAPEAAQPAGRAQRVLLDARRRRLLAERRALERELPFYDATRELLRARLDLAVQRVNQAEKLVARWKEAVDARTREQAQRQAWEARWEVIRVRPEVLPLAQENQRLAELRAAPDGPAARVQQAEAQWAGLREQLDTLRRQFAHVEELAALSANVGVLLVEQRNSLPAVALHRRQMARRRESVAATKLELLEWNAARARLADPEPEVQAVLARLPAETDPRDRADVERAVRELLAKRIEHLDALIADDSKYLDLQLFKLDATEADLVRVTEEFSAYIRRQMRWRVCVPPLGLADLARLPDAVRWLTDPVSWRAVGEELARDARQSPLLVGLAAAGVLLLIAAQGRLRAAVRRAADALASPTQAGLRPTLVAAGATLLLSLPWPAALGFVGWRLHESAAPPAFAATMAPALGNAALVAWLIESLRQVCRRKGLAEAHFGWPARWLAAVRHQLGWAELATVPAAFVLAACEAQTDDLIKVSLGRVTLVAWLLVVAGLTWRGAREAGAFARPAAGAAAPGRAAQGTSWWAWLAVGGPLAVALIATTGYYYTALELAWRVLLTGWAVGLVLVAAALLVRGLVVAQRRLALSSLASTTDSGPARGGGPERAAVRRETDWLSVDRQVRRLIRWGSVAALLMVGWTLWADLVPGAEALAGWQFRAEHVLPAGLNAADGSTGSAAAAPPVALPTGAVGWSRSAAGSAASARTPGALTLGDVVVALLVAGGTLIVSNNLPGLLELLFLRRLPFDVGGRYAVASVLGYLVLVVGLVVAFSMIGVPWSSLQWLVAAITVGLGFGLQEIFANFVSGLILLVERPIRIGDTVTVGTVTGSVSQIRGRATVITNWDRQELIVPNKDFITGQLVNWTLSDQVLRLVFRVGVSYAADPRQVTELLMRLAREQPQVLDDPPPIVVFQEFGDSALAFELRVHVPRLDDAIPTRHALNVGIHEAFRAAGIEIPYPQRDLHLRTVPAGLADMPGIEPAGPRPSGKETP